MGISPKGEVFMMKQVEEELGFPIYRERRANAER